jgi:hypothetical protein
VIALFPNITILSIRWEASDDGVYDLKPTSSGNQLRHLKRLHIYLKPDHYNDRYESLEAAAAQMLVEHFHMPSLETITIRFSISDFGRGYIDDFVAIRAALCGIASPTLQRVTVSVNLPIWTEPFPQAWVSTSSSCVTPC